MHAATNCRARFAASSTQRKFVGARWAMVDPGGEAPRNPGTPSVSHTGLSPWSSHRCGGRGADARRREPRIH
eukprot:15430410-Alexandrium_andersonii.AAC.1